MSPVKDIRQLFLAKHYFFNVKHQ